MSSYEKGAYLCNDHGYVAMRTDRMPSLNSEFAYLQAATNLRKG
jgi:hypothetical protein